MDQRVIGFIAGITLFLSCAPAAFAVSEPGFPSCVNPQGQLIVEYKDGNHGLPGDGQTYFGSDKVYRLSQTQVLQCMCSDNGAAKQTNWQKAAGYTEDEIKSLTLQGWTYIPDGSAWGLDPVAYVAKNYPYRCKSEIGGGSGSTGGGSSSTGGSDVSGTSAAIGAVLGLASTGSLQALYNLWLAGLVLLTSGVWIAWLKQQLGKKS